jgi:hypothetical protein
LCFFAQVQASIQVQASTQETTSEEQTLAKQKSEKPTLRKAAVNPDWSA